MARPSPRTALGALLLLGAGLGAGLLAARAWPRASGAPVPEARGETADDAGARRGGGIRVSPRRRPPDDVMEQLGALGYAESYEAVSEVPGVSQYSPARSYAGVNLIVSGHAPTAVLADMEGRHLHEWTYPCHDLPGVEHGFRGKFRRAHLLEEGGLLAIFDNTALIRLDAESNLLWSVMGGFHHDLEVTADGAIFVLDQEPRIVPGFHETKPTVENFITEVSLEGQVLERWSLLEAFERSDYRSFLEKAAAGGDNFHTNTLEILDGSLAHLSPLFAAGHALISVWGLDVIAIVDLEENRVIWALSGMWHRQHQPVLLENGNVLLFDNMGHGEWSKVIELEPFTQRIVWAYEGDLENDFYSRLLGSCQRLPNGNTLITESLRATAFEVTPEGETVWRFVSPYRFDRETEDLPVLMEVVRLGSETPLDWLD